MQFPVFLIEAKSLNGAGDEITHYWSTHGFTTEPDDTPANLNYKEVVADPGMFGQSLFSEGATRGNSETAYGAIRLSNANGELDDLVNHSFDGREIKILRLPDPDAGLSDAETVLIATMEGLDSSQAWLYFIIRIYDRRLELDRPLQTSRYEGTTATSDGTYEGTTDLKGEVKPIAFGRVRGVEPVAVNPYQWLYQLSDSVLTSVVAYDGGSPRTPRGDQATVAAALSASILAGQFNTCYAEGIVRFGGIKPHYVLTCDITEGGPSERDVASIAERMLDRMGINGSDIVSSSFSALSSEVPYEAGIYIDSDETGLSALSRCLSSVGAYIVPNRLGQFEVGRLEFTTPSMVIGEDDILINPSELGLVQNPDTEGNVPTWRVIVRYQKLQRALDNSNVAGCASMDEEWRQYLTTEWREVVAEDETIKDRHLLAGELTVETCLDDEDDAQEEADRLLAMYGTRRDVIVIEMLFSDAPLIGSTVTVEIPRFGYDTGRDMIVISRRDEFAKDISRLTLWG